MGAYLKGGFNIFLVAGHIPVVSFLAQTDLGGGLVII